MAELDAPPVPPSLRRAIHEAIVREMQQSTNPATQEMLRLLRAEGKVSGD